LLKLHFHPLASFCHKALIALYENGTPFEPTIIDFGDPASAAAFRKVWPMAKMPVLEDVAAGRTVMESTIVIEYLDRFHPGATRFLPDDPQAQWQVRMWDRIFDHYVEHPMQKIVTDNIRPADGRDPFGVEQARAQLAEVYDLIEWRLEGRTWAAGDMFTLADCAAAPALFYANTVMPFPAGHRNLAAYLHRLMTRPSYARVLREAEPYFGNFPMERKPDISVLDA